MSYLHVSGLDSADKAMRDLLNRYRLRVYKYCMISVLTVMGGITLIVAYGQIVCWVIPAERQTRRIRLKFLECVLRQEVGWYDVRGVGELNTRLSE